MSAFLCSDATFDYLAVAARIYGRTMNFYPRATMPDLSELISEGILDNRDHKLNSITDSDKIAAVLQYQNVRSIKARYPTKFEVMLNDAPYVFRSVPPTALTPARVLKSVSCVRYQSCETDDYDQTFAAAILSAIEHAAITSLPGYEDAPWGWEREVSA